MTKKSLKRRISDDAEESPPTETVEEKKKGGGGGGYSTDKDVCLKKIGSIEGESDRAGSIVVRVMSYNSGPKKIAVMNTGTKKDGTEWFAKLGRISPQQAKRLRVLLRKAINFLED